jgi:voltage-gated potassium channel
MGLRLPLAARLAALLDRLKAEDIPRRAGLTAAALLVSGLAIVQLERPTNPAFAEVGDGLWWALVTITTIGYGDKFPITTGGRLMAAVLVFFGIGMVGIVTGKIASILVERRIKEGRGLSDAHHLSDHTVVLGWKTDMHSFVKEILALSADLSPARLVLVNLGDELLNHELRDLFPGLVYLRGDVLDAMVLQRAHVAGAAKVIILADQAAHHTDQETDSRTVMAAMTVKGMAPEVYTCAELLDKKYEENLRLAQCDEVVLSRDYSRALLVSATRSAGITHVLRDLLDPKGLGLMTVPVPGEFVGRTVGELAGHLKGRQQLLIGLLENTGRARAKKREALREAQKTTNVATLVENLRRVKDLRPNEPNLAPPETHVIAAHTLAIVVGRTAGQGA